MRTYEDQSKYGWHHFPQSGRWQCKIVRNGIAYRAIFYTEEWGPYREGDVAIVKMYGNVYQLGEIVVGSVQDWADKGCTVYLGEWDWLAPYAERYGVEMKDNPAPKTREGPDLFDEVAGGRPQ